MLHLGAPVFPPPLPNGQDLAELIKRHTCSRRRVPFENLSCRSTTRLRGLARRKTPPEHTPSAALLAAALEP